MELEDQNLESGPFLVIIEKNSHNNHIVHLKEIENMDIKIILLVLTGVFILTSLFFGTKNGFYDSDNYDGNGTAH
jgi:hypothetical protein